LHPLQKAFLDYGAYQCGFCTAGMLMSCKGLFKYVPNPTNEQIRDGIDGKHLPLYRIQQHHPGR